MTLTLVLVLVLALLVGVSLGLLGGGGSILTVPLLVYVAGMDAKEAIATSLFVVGVTSAVGMINHARGGRVRWRTGVLFGAAGMAGAYTGGLVGGHIPDAVLLIAFAVMMIVTAAAMLRGRRGVDPDQAHRQLPVGRVLLDGAAVGLATGLVGAGGGFLVVPALALLGGLPMPVAIGTSLLVIAMKSAAGFAGYLSSVQIDWTLTLAVTGFAVVGSLAGARLAGRVPAHVLSRLFAWFVLAMGAFVLIQQAPAHTAVPVLAALASLGAGAGVCYGFVARCPLRRAVHRT
ncbi:sulfite exporter TauE/SafE family protein [Streptomyces sp. NPDC088106]|uniref:sulfite exporter TauE/SafE family protein n=1 Tax=unclassified Streptomyces TaxID=2593676 RepID=UPI0033F6A2DC